MAILETFFPVNLLASRPTAETKHNSTKANINNMSICNTCSVSKHTESGTQKYQNTK